MTATYDVLSGIEGATLAYEREQHALAIRADLEMAGRIRDYIGSYIVFPGKFRDAYLDLLTAYVIHTYAFRWQGVTPYLAVTAPTQGSGKTRVLEILATLVSVPSGIETNPTEPVIRKLAEEGRTLLLDEIDTLVKDTAFIGTMNSGYRAGGSVSRVSGRSATFCPKVIAGIAREGRLPLPTATLSRCIDIKMLRARPDEIRRRFRMEVMHDDAGVTAMREWAGSWAKARSLEIRDAYFSLPELSDSRASEVWEPLITIAGLLGGNWYERMVSAAKLLDGYREHSTDPNAALIADVAVVIRGYLQAAPAATQIRVADLTDLRNTLTGRKLSGTLTEEQVVRRLGAFGLQPSVITRNGEDMEVFTIANAGTLLPDWADVFSRYAAA